VASHTIASVNDLWPDGTSVGAYLRDAFGNPSGAAVDTKSVTAGALAFTGLADGTNYIASQGGKTKQFRTPATPVSAGSGITVQDEASDLTVRPKINFTGAGVTATDNAGANRTDVSISGAGVSDASSSVKGVTRLSKDPAVAATPIALGVNDERVSPQASASANLTGTVTVDFASIAQEKWLPGPLTGNLTVNGQASAVAGSRLRILAVQGATPRTITVDGNAVTPISQVNGALILVDVLYVDVGGTITPRIVATTTEADPLAILKSLVNAKGDLIAATADDTVAAVTVGANNSILVGDSGAAAGVSYKTLLTLLAAVLTPTNGNVITGNGSAWTSAAPAAGGGAGFWKSPFIAGQTYQPALPVAGTNVGLNNGVATATPFIPGRTGTISAMRVRQQTVTGAGGVYRLGVYSHDPTTGKPKDLVADVGTFDGTVSATIKAITGLSVALTADTIYWLVCVQQGAASNGALRGHTDGGSNPLCPMDPTNVAVGVGFSATIAGALPANTIASDWAVASQSYAIQLLAA
jgi:hypothetical protein